MSSCECQGCHETFSSRNAVFRHLKDTQGACLDPEDYQDFCQFVQEQKRDKVVILYGYIVDAASERIRNGEDAAQELLVMLHQGTDRGGNDKTKTRSRANRSYGSLSRSIEIVAQDDGTGAVTEVLTTKLPPLLTSLDEWIDWVNQSLDERVQGTNAQIRVLGRQNMPFNKFNAEVDVSHRRIEYLLPVDFLYNHNEQQSRQYFFDRLPCFADGTHSRNEQCPSIEQEQRPNPETLAYLLSLKKIMQTLTTHIVALDENDSAAMLEKKFHTKKRHRSRYNNPLTLSTADKPLRSKNGNDEESTEAPQHVDKSNGSTNGAKSDKKQNKKKGQQNRKKESGKGQNVLRRRRYHNFTPTVMAHEFLAYRRLDRLYHRSTLRFAMADDGTVTRTLDSTERPFLALCMTGDLFLTGQACRIVGLFVALARGVIDPDFVDMVFDEAYPHLVPTPPAPLLGMYASEACYTSWEGKAKAILTPRKCDRYENGWNDDETIDRVQTWHTTVRERTAQSWLQGGTGDNGGLLLEKQWREQVLEPWAKKARIQLEDYRKWKTSLTACSSTAADQGTEVTTSTSSDIAVAPCVSLLPPLQSADATVPALFEKVLHHLRQADASGLWPSTTPKRQLVMVSTPTDNDEKKDGDSALRATGFASSLSEAHVKARSNKKDDGSTAYAFVEGEGGASGSFSVGAMPGDQCLQPKGNSLFPELMKAAFELEIALCPDREPSSTIAINRNAQFRPHTDSGAGAGQSTSLIVGLGTYVGGELVVEGEQKDIRYKAIEFNGWKQRHWTMPFRGERYSLVWFTPKGCEGVRGIDLCTTSSD